MALHDSFATPGPDWQATGEQIDRFLAEFGGA
jgi:hypothetical protein